MKSFRTIKLKIYPNTKKAEAIKTMIIDMNILYNHMLELKFSQYRLNDEITHVSYREIASDDLIQKYKDTTLAQVQWDNEDQVEDILKLYEKTNYLKLRKLNGYGSVKLANYNKHRIFDLLNENVNLPIIGGLKYKGTNLLYEDDTPTKLVLSYELDNHYYLSFKVERRFVYVEDFSNVNEDMVIGLDYSQSKLYVDSNGKSSAYEYPPSSLYQRSKYLQSRLSKLKSDTCQYRKLKGKLARTNNKIKNFRNNQLHQISSRLVDQYVLIIIEDLDLRNMAKRNNQGRKVYLNAYSKFVKMLEYKAQAKGAKIVKIDRFAPTSQLCSACHCINKIALGVNTYECQNCNLKINRDYNAALNIKMLGCSKFNIARNA